MARFKSSPAKHSPAAVPIVIAMLGRQGSGKSTQSERLSRELGLVHVYSGELLREASRQDNETGRRIKKCLDVGEMAPVELTLEIMADRLRQPDVLASGVVMDGFPRTLVQAQSMSWLVEHVDGAISVDVPVAEALARLEARGREDDTPESLAKRLELYEIETAPLLGWFQKAGIALEIVDGLGNEDEVFQRVLAVTRRFLGLGTTTIYHILPAATKGSYLLVLSEQIQQRYLLSPGSQPGQWESPDLEKMVDDSSIEMIYAACRDAAESDDPARLFALTGSEVRFR